jgi:Flp pilus assembly pilin Flp
MPWSGKDNQNISPGPTLFPAKGPDPKEMVMISLLAQLWSSDDGQDIAEYAVMLAVILVLVVGTIRLIGSNANTAFSQAASAVQ